MVIHAGDMKNEVKHEMRGGTGHVSLLHAVPAEGLNGRGRMFARVTLEQGCSIGYHEHHGESELFYILSGEGVLSDDGEEKRVVAGDCAVCPDGQGHSIRNDGAEPLVLMALILFAGER